MTDTVWVVMTTDRNPIDVFDTAREAEQYCGDDLGEQVYIGSARYHGRATQ